MTKGRVSVAVGVLAAALHFVFCLFIHYTPAEGSWQWFPVFLIDFPASILPLVAVPASVPPLLSFGLVGSIWWALLVGWISHLFRMRKQSEAGA
jgi:hypothetical protein